MTNSQLQPIISGPCVICGATNYDLSCGGPTICPKCDCGQFDAATVMMQSKALASLRSQASELRDALRESQGQLTKLAAECHRAKWEFDLSDDFKPSAKFARAMILTAFRQLHRIGDLAMVAAKVSAVNSQDRGST